MPKVKKVSARPAVPYRAQVEVLICFISFLLMLSAVRLLQILSELP